MQTVIYIIMAAVAVYMLVSLSFHFTVPTYISYIFVYASVEFAAVVVLAVLANGKQQNITGLTVALGLSILFGVIFAACVTRLVHTDDRLKPIPPIRPMEPMSVPEWPAWPDWPDWQDKH